MVARLLRHGTRPLSKTEEEGPLRQVERMRSEKPLPLGTAILSNVALSLLMWNIALRLASLFTAS
jgi:hypothetical protein